MDPNCQVVRRLLPRDGRAYWLSTKDANTRSLFRISAVDDPKPGLIGKYQNRADAMKVVSQIAYQSEPRS